MKKIWLFLLLVLLVLPGCSFAKSQPAENTQSVSPTSTELIQRVSASLSPDVIPTSSPTETPIPTPLISRSCIELTSSINSDGILVAETRNMTTSESSYFLIDLTSSIKVLTGPGPIWNIVGVSSDRKKLLYEYDYKDYTHLAITDSSGKGINDFAAFFDGDYATYYSWIDNYTIRVVRIDRQEFTIIPIALDINTGKYQKLKNVWSDLYTNQISDTSNLDWGIDTRAIQSLYFGGANIIYDPTLSRVVYPKNGQVVSLTNADTGQELASIHLPEWGRLPRWSDDGEYLVLIASTDPKAAPGHDEFFIVSRDGPDFKRLTYLTNQFEKVYISEYSWSPDGRQIAFWLNTEAVDAENGKTQSELVVLDIATGEVTNLCIQGISEKIVHDFHMIYPQPLWSPDGHQIAFTQLNSENEKSFNVLILDLDAKTASIITSDKEPIGWMVKEP